VLARTVLPLALGAAALVAVRYRRPPPRRQALADRTIW
jgi:hypothetical protein